MRRRKMRIKMDRPRLYALLLLVAHRKAREHGEVDFGGYLLDLSSNLVQFQSAISKIIHLDAKCEHLHVTLNKAVPLGLVCNEFIMNSIKHAFPNRLLLKHRDAQELPR